MSEELEEPEKEIDWSKISFWEWFLSYFWAFLAIVAVFFIFWYFVFMR